MDITNRWRMDSKIKYSVTRDHKYEFVCSPIRGIYNKPSKVKKTYKMELPTDTKELNDLTDRIFLAAMKYKKKK